MVSDNIRIYIAYHKKSKVVNGPYLYPIQVGAAGSEERFDGMLYDDTGENISPKNRSYGEMTAQYWAWKNENADYYGFFHYRRFMSFSDDTFRTNRFGDVEMEYMTDANISGLCLEKDRMREIINSYDIIATTPVVLNHLDPSLHNNYQQYIYVDYQFKDDMDRILELIKEKSPDMYKTARRYMFKLSYGYFCNMFIMKKELFDEYCSWVFDLLDEFEKGVDYAHYSIDGERLCGYLGERLFGIFYEYKKGKGCRTRELQRTLFHNTDIPKPVTAFMDKKDVPVVIASNNYYAPYISTLLLSIADNSSSDRCYRIYILSHDMTDENRHKLKDMLGETENISIEYLDPDYLLDGYDLYTRGHFSRETYYRLVLPELFEHVSKLVYIDVDMIVQADLAELYDTDVEGYLLAATYDPDTAGLYNGYQPDKKQYMDTVMKLKDPYKYFQAGTLVINLDEFRRSFSTREILDLSASEEWQLLDQDILNVLCEGRVRFLDMSWNVMYDHLGVRLNETVRLAPKWLYNTYIESRKHPRIIHYAGPEKPWLYPEADFADEYWEYARKSPYYEILLYRMSIYAANRDKRETLKIAEEKRKGELNPVARTIRCLRLYGIRHTICEIKMAVSANKKQ